MYGELIVGINMVFNYAILSFANRMVKAQATSLRLLLASFVGAFLVTIFPDSVIVVFIAFGVMIACAFGISLSAIGNLSVIVLIGALFAGGVLTVFTDQIVFLDSKSTVFLSALVAYVVLYILKTKWLDVRVARQLSSYSVQSVLSIWNEKISIPCFIDTGNRCTDPLSGDPVHFVSFKVVERLIPEELKAPLLTCKTGEMPQLSVFPKHFQKSLRLIRLQTVSGASWTVGFKFDSWIIEEGSELPAGYIVFTKQDNRYPEGASAIMHASALESITIERGTNHVART